MRLHANQVPMEPVIKSGHVSRLDGFDRRFRSAELEVYCGSAGIHGAQSNCKSQQCLLITASGYPYFWLFGK